MKAEIVFGGGHRVLVTSTSAAGLTQALGSSRSEDWVRVSTELEGEILVNPSQIAYLREIGEQESILEETL